MNHKFVKHILIDNGRDLSKTLGYNFDKLWVSKLFEVDILRAWLQGYMTKSFKKIFNNLWPDKF